jgi:hypothetical protein
MTFSLGRQLLDSMRRDVGGFLAALSPAEPPSPGMYTYHITPPGGQIRIHLRIEGDGRGILFVDVTEVVHLNPTAAHMAKLALDEVPQLQARAMLGRHCPANERQRLAAELTQIYAMIERFTHPNGECPTCAVAGLERAPLFSQRARAPYKADLALTYGCNNECPHCYNEPDRFDMPSMPKEEWFRVLDTLHGVGVPHIILTGGEATMHPDLPEIIRYANELGQVVD